MVNLALPWGVANAISSPGLTVNGFLGSGERTTRQGSAMQAKRDQDFFWEGIDRGVLLAQKCDGCGQLRHPPQPGCAKCGSDQWSETVLSGEGTILAFIESVHPTRRDEESRCVCLVELPEGLRMISSLLDPENAGNGAAVKFEIAEHNGQLLPLVRTVGESQ
jgi:uncharacterized OB-fold protein